MKKIHFLQKKVLTLFFHRIFIFINKYFFRYLIKKISKKKIKVLIIGRSFVDAISRRLLSYGYDTKIISAEKWRSLEGEGKKNHFKWAHYIVFTCLQFKLLDVESAIQSHCETVVLFIGTDVLKIRTASKLHQNNSAKISRISKFIAVHPNLVYELKSLDIQCRYFKFIAKKIEPEPYPLPEKFSVLTYIPENIEVFYGFSYIYQLARELPQVPFVVLGHSGKHMEVPKNIQFMGWQADTRRFIKNSTVYIRLTEHDGMPNLVAEALSLARYVIWTMDYAHCVRFNDVSSCKKILLSLARYKTPNLQAMRYIVNEFSEDKQRKLYLRLFV